MNLPRRRRRLNLAEGGRADVVIGHAKVHPVQNVEKLSTELQRRGFRQPKILGDSEVPFREARGLDDISAGVAEGPELGVLLERLGVEPFARSPWAVIGITHQVRTVTDKPRYLGRLSLQRRVARIVNGKWRACRGGDNAVQLPVTQRALVPIVGFLPEGEQPLIAEDQSLAGIEERPAILRLQVRKGSARGHFRQRRVWERSP